MTPGTRIALLAAAAVILVGGIVLASADGDDPEGAGVGTEASETQQGGGGAEAPGETGAQQAPRPRVETIRMRDRAPVGEPRTLRYGSGDTVRLRFASDVAEQVHIHGYDRYVDVPAGRSARTRFEADLEGIFEIESHGSGELLAKLEVRP